MIAKDFSVSNRWEYAVPALAIASLISSCLILSAKRYFWYDELLTYYLVSDKSFGHMLVAYSDKFTNVPPLYFVLCRFWATAFTATEISLRLFSCLAVCVAFLAVWFTLRRSYSFWPACVGALSLFCASYLVLYHTSEARMYGLFMAACALAVFHFQLAGDGQRCRVAFLVATVLVHVAIVQTHLFGIIYSGAILVAFIARDQWLKAFRPRIYLSIFASWLSLLPVLPALINQADAGNPRAWLSAPGYEQLLAVSAPSSPIFQWLILLLILISLAQLAFRAGPRERVSASAIQSANPKAEVSLGFAALSFLAVPSFAWIFSHAVKPIFLDRYMIPSALVWPILLATLASRLIRSPALLSRAAARVTLALLGLVTTLLLLYPVDYAIAAAKQQRPGSSDSKYGYADLPMVVLMSHDFIARFHYSAERSRYFFVLDWPAAVDVRSGSFPPQEYKEMEALRREYPEIFGKNVLQTDEFLRLHRRFLVLVYPDRGAGFHSSLWLEMRINSNPRYQTRNLGGIDGRRLLLVESRDQPPL